jgi:hypothetical protein
MVAPINLVKYKPNTLRISDMAINATINEAAYLELPSIDPAYSYAVTSKQGTFEASVDGNRLKVLSKNEADVGTNYFDLTATSLSNNATFRVKITYSSTLNDTSIVS